MRCYSRVIHLMKFNMNSIRSLSLSVSLILIILASPIRGENLYDVYELALKNDPLLRAAEATYRAGKENKAQGIAGLLPTLSIGGSTNWNEYRIEEQLQDQYNSNSYYGNINQPIFRLDKWFQFERGSALSESAEAEFAYQQQETMIRVASAYFNVLNSFDNLNAAQAEEKAIQRQKDLAKKRFDVGLAAITEVQETQAAYDLTIVSRISRQAQLDSAQETLTSIIGRDISLLSPLSDNFEISLPDPLDRESWVSLGLKNNYQLKSAKLQRDAAQASARASASNHLPQIDLVGRISQSTSKQGKFGGFIQNPLFGIEQDTRQYSIQFNLPLFAGGAISSARRQAYANYDRSKEQAIYTERSTIRDVRSNHFGVQTQVANVTARKQALASAESALKATEVG